MVHTYPHRNEVWWVRLSDPSTRRGPKGSEEGAKPDKAGANPRIGPEWRPCVVVSNDEFNENSAAVTVAVFTKYREDKEHRLERWAATVYTSSYPRNLHMSAHGFDPVAGRGWTDSVIDCAMLATVYAVPDDSAKFSDHITIPSINKRPILRPSLG